ncbi:MAG: hypothetical protein FJ088_10110, partial [Deltaproteobacteria bacterium]|nr:hypothetical protein [Deltaproteobacteria bacterium]
PLKQSAARLFLDVLLSGPDKPFFQNAFNELRKLRKEINYNPPDIEKLSAFFVDNFSQNFQDEFFYVLGEFYYDYGNFQKANKYFEKVSENSKDRAKALYLTGLIQVKLKLFKSAVESFQNAILSAEQTGADQDVIDLSYLALARIAYETLTEDLSNYDAAIFYYRKIPTNSYRLPSAIYESAWTFFQKEDYSRAIGAIHALRSPYFLDYFYPELWILEATMYLNLCRYELARHAIEMFDKEVAQYGEPLRKFMMNQKTPEDYYNSFVAAANGDAAKGLTKKLALPVLSNVEFYNVYRTIRQIEKEEKELAASVDKLGEFGTNILNKLQVLKKDKINEAGIKIQQILKTIDTDLSEYAVKVTEIELDINTIEIEMKTIEMRKLAGEIEEATLAPKAREGAVAIVGGDTVSWPFEGDYWKDEVRYYRSFLEDECSE